MINDKNLKICYNFFLEEENTVGQDPNDQKTQKVQDTKPAPAKKTLAVSTFLAIFDFVKTIALIFVFAFIIDDNNRDVHKTI